MRLLTGGPSEQTIALDLASLPPATRKVVAAAAIDGPATFGTVGAIQIGSTSPTDRQCLRASRPRAASPPGGVGSARSPVFRHGFRYVPVDT